jgi:hypothetical protein
MATADIYRATADRCLQSARDAETDAGRRLYRRLAVVWLEAALRQDEASFLRLPPAPRLADEPSD